MQRCPDGEVRCATLRLATILQNSVFAGRADALARRGRRQCESVDFLVLCEHHYYHRIVVEQRRHARARLEHPIEYSSKNDDFLVRLDAVGKDISLGGMFIETVARASLGEQLLIYLTLPRSHREMALPGTVRWLSGDGFGLQFGLFGARDTHDITEFVRGRAQSE